MNLLLNEKAQLSALFQGAFFLKEMLFAYLVTDFVIAVGTSWTSSCLYLQRQCTVEKFLPVDIQYLLLLLKHS